MKFFAFHLMPYRHLDFAAAESFNSYWIDFPNSFYDRDKGEWSLLRLSSDGFGVGRATAQKGGGEEPTYVFSQQ